jgi:glycolate oxidase iron-sulfur subunit
MDIMTPAAAEASLGLLCEIGLSVHVLPNSCCGLPAKSYGDVSAAKKLAEKNLEMISSEAFDLLVTDCSSCAAFLKRYPALFAEGDVLHAKAHDVASCVRDIVELVCSHSLSIGDEDKPTIVTYHDPCHASRGQGIVKEPREILRSIAGIEYRELPEADWCCGGAGSYALSHYGLAMKVLERKMDNLEKTGANVLVTSCPACIIHLAYGIRLRNFPVRVCHISELLRSRLRKPLREQ